MSATLKASREQLINEAWHRGRLSFLLHSGQLIIDQKYNDSKNKLFVCNVSRQFGKSYWAVTKAVSIALSKPKARIKYGTAYQTDLVEFIQPTFATVLESCPKSIKPVYKVNGSKWVFSNGSEIKLVGLDKSPDSLRGNILDAIIIDEAGFCGDLDHLYKSIIVPATLHRPNCKIIMISTPPSTPAHGFVDFIQRASAEGGYVKLDIYANPLITSDDIECMAKELGGIKSTSFRRECLCELITDADSQIIPEWHDGSIVDTKQDQFYPFYQRYVSMDLGVKDFTLALFGYYDFRRATLVIQDEIKLNGPTLTTQLLKDSVEAKEKHLWVDSKPRRISDNNNPQLIQDLSILHKMYFQATSKDSLEAMINEVRLMVQKGQIEVHPRCVQLIGCLQYGVWDAKKKAFARSSTYGHFDALAALVYLVRNLDKFTNPIPATFGWDISNTRFKSINNQSENAKTFSQLFHKPTRKI